MTPEERVRALLGNLKNWTWDVFPQFKMEKEDSDALRAVMSELYADRKKLHDLEEELNADR